VKQGKVLGKGAYGMVTRGSYLGAYPVAVKVPLSDEAEKSVAQEGALMHDVHSPHTVGALGRFTTRGKLGYVMALAQKGDVESLQKEIAAIPDPTERLNVIRHLARGGFEGLRDLHQRGRVHGDVKDGNLLLDDGYEARLTDFGASAEATQGQTTGTGAYMAPRLGAGLERNGPAADVWSMGETILHLLLGVTSTALAPKDMVPSPETQQARRKDQATKLQPEALEKHAKKLETRDDRLWDGRWFANLEKEIAKLKGLPAEDGRDLLDFLRKVMAYQPGDRLGAKSALEHKFLDKKKAALGKAQMPQLVARRDAKKKK
jgi:serine/threonine protein kinase